MAISMVTSGIVAKATTDDTPVELIAAQSGRNFRNARIDRESTADGFLSFDGGESWMRFTLSIIEVYGVAINGAVQMKRTAGGSNITGVYAAIW